MQLDDYFDKFQKEWEGVNLTRYEGKLLYKVAAGYSKRAAARANNLIEILNLPLVAIPKKTWPEDSFIVQSK